MLLVTSNCVATVITDSMILLSALSLSKEFLKMLILSNHGNSTESKVTVRLLGLIFFFFFLGLTKEGLFCKLLCFQWLTIRAIEPYSDIACYTYTLLLFIHAL